MKPELQKQADQLMIGLLRLGEQSWIGPSDIRGLVRPLALANIEAEIYLLRELGEVARMIPLKIFRDPEDRLRLVDAVQQALDDAIEREEEAEQ